MELNEIYNLVAEEYFRGKDVEEFIDYREAIVNLRKKYRSNECDPNYSEEDIKAYMLTYFPVYCLQTNVIVDKLDLKQYFNNSKNLNMAILGTGPSTEVIGLGEYFKGKNILFRLYDYEEKWSKCRIVAKKFLEINNMSGNFDPIYGCDLLLKCDYCENKSRCKSKFKKADLILIQNCLNHMNDKDDFMEKLKFIITNMKKDALFLIIDFNYEICLNLMYKIYENNIDIVNKISLGNNELKIDACEYPYYIRKVFNGKENLILRKYVKSYYLLLQRK